jgi:hypothetical protein
MLVKPNALFNSRLRQQTSIAGNFDWREIRASSLSAAAVAKADFEHPCVFHP